MPKPTKGPRLGGGPAHERLLLANLAAALFTHKSIQTTQTKAKRLQPLAERLITFAKRGDLHARRRVLGVIGDKGVVHELFTEIAPLVAERAGGYTRITKTGFRKGDNAPLAVIELVLEPVAVQPASVRRKPAATAAPTPAAEPADQAEQETAAEEAVPVEETETVEQSAPAPSEDENAVAAEVEADAAEKADKPATADDSATADESATADGPTKADK